MSVKSSGSTGDGGGGGVAGIAGEVVRVGYLKKLKTMRKKFFVLRAETVENSSRLEYYDSEKKYRSTQPPKRSISLTACFNINRRVDTKYKHVIALYTKDDCFCVVLETERDLEEWLKALLSLQHGEDVVDGEPPKPTFEHVWQVTMLNKGLGNSRNIIGPYHLCFTDKTLSLVRKSVGGIGSVVIGGGHPDHVEFSLMSIRRCGHSDCFFYMEVGRSAMTGAGELWMQTEDTNIAQNMGDIILRAMSNNNNKEDFRKRSSSANEASKPILVQRRQTHSGQKSTSYCSPSQGIGGRERCDSMPSRARTSSEGTTPMTVTRSHLTPHRPQSFYGRDISHSPPAGSPVSPASAACSTDSAGSSLSIDEPDAWPDYSEPPLNRYGHSLTPDEPIVEEETSDCSPYVQHSPLNGSPLTGAYVPMAPLSSDDGYVDMSPRGRHADMSPAASSCSVTSGTPSTDMRFSEYHLEKVTSYFTPSEDDDNSNIDRPHRAYSVGSRPDVLKLRTKLDAHDSTARVRAFSVGSRSKGVHNRVLPPHGHPPSSSSTGKSSSAPLLSGSHNLLLLGGSNSSMERMDDLMEMDFSKPPNTTNNSGYVDMSPRNVRPILGYVEMKPGTTPEISASSPSSSYVEMRPGSSPSSSYVEMRLGSSASSPLKPAYIPSTSPHKTKSPYYVEMTGNKLSTSPKNINKTSSPIQEEYMDMDFQSNRNRTLTGAGRTQPVDLPKKHSEGYMEMLWGGGQIPQHQQHQPNRKNDDYMNMAAPTTKKAEKTRKKEKIRSQPIAIQTNQTIHSFATFLQNSTRKNSTGTPPIHPPNYLPLTSTTTTTYSPGSSPYSSLRRPRSRKNSRRNSKETPTNNETTIFPFSPGSPVKQPETSTSSSSTRKCAVDATSGTVKLTDYVTDDYLYHAAAAQLTSLTIKPFIFEAVQEPRAASPRPGDTAPQQRDDETSTMRTDDSAHQPCVDSSVSSSGLLHYASLDLASTDGDDGTRSPRNVPRPSSPPESGEQNFTYAEIDFNKSEGLKNNKIVKH